MAGTLYVVSTPIGNPKDLTLRGRRVLAEADAVICEEQRIGSTLLGQHGLSKPLVELNEHTEEEQVPALLERLAQGENLALISDHGTPLVADPGAGLVKRAIVAGVSIVPIPGPSAAVAALVSSGLPASRFRFLGQLPAKTELRERALEQLKTLPETLVLLDAPYRLMPVLKSIKQALGSERRMAVACNLTMSDEHIVRGTVAEIIRRFEREPFKGEFVLLIAGSPRNPQQRS